MTPIQAFMTWFNGLPEVLRQDLAHLFQVSTTEDATLMVATKPESLVRFRLWVQKSDFPLRMAAKVFYIRSVFDLMIVHHKQILSPGAAGLPGSVDVVDLSDFQWQALVDSWQVLRNKELSDAYVHSWAAYAIQVKAEEIC